MAQENRMTIIVLFPFALELIGLLFAVTVDPYVSKRQRRIMLMIIGLIFILLIQNTAEHYLVYDIAMPFIRTMIAVLGYAIRPVILLMFLYLIGNRKSYRPEWILLIINTCIHLTAFFSAVCFRISAQNRFVRGPLGYTCHIVSAILLFELLYATYHRFSDGKRQMIVIPLFNVILIILSVVLDSFIYFRYYPVTFLTIAVVNCSFLYYIWMHLQFAKEHEKDLMAQQRIRIMVSQIQPHFLYNTLSTIQALCKIDPDKAAETIERFGTYLRANLDSLNQETLVPLQKELDHTRIYGEIEKERFPDIDIVYEIDDVDFLLPALSIQPLVENAIRHGVRGRKDGRILVKTKNESGNHVIIIEDNGTGFDVNALKDDDSDHIGLFNVRERIASMCNGTMEIESTIDQGTKIIITIPEEKA
ncbi:MAG: histidine kinase [Erysipelotrichaceae bacterium]|nr:histidine kinase [Erysipelotrichaceae bacterium]